MIIRCGYCGASVDKPTGAVNRAVKGGKRLFCGFACSADAKRVDPAEKKRRLAEYGKRRRAAMGGTIKEQKRQWYQANAKAIHERHAAQMESDPEYRERHKECQRRCQESPEWKAHKAEYDRRYRADRMYGEMADAYLILLMLDDEVERQEPDRVELYRQKGTLNKSQERKRNGNREETER